MTFDLKCPNCGGHILQLNEERFGDGVCVEIICQSSPLCRERAMFFTTSGARDAIKGVMETWNALPEAPKEDGA